MAAIYGRHMIDTLHERMGGDAQLLGPGKAGYARRNVGQDHRLLGPSRR